MPGSIKDMLEFRKRWRSRYGMSLFSAYVDICKEWNMGAFEACG